MKKNFLDMLPVSFETELFDTKRCQKFSEQLNDFENAVFGPDFACKHEQIEHWVASGCFFSATVCGEAVKGHQTILSTISMLITTSRSRDRLLAGEIADYELVPWTSGPAAEQPTLYFSSVVSDAPHHLAAMYESVFDEVMAFRETHGLSFHSGFAIASGFAGRRHMDRNGFRGLPARKYLGNYDLLVIDSATAATAFWQELLSAETVFLRRRDNENGVPPKMFSTPSMCVN